MAKKRTYEELENINNVNGSIASTSIHVVVVTLSPVNKRRKSMLYSNECILYRRSPWIAFHIWIQTLAHGKNTHATFMDTHHGIKLRARHIDILVHRSQKHTSIHNPST